MQHPLTAALLALPHKPKGVARVTDLNIEFRGRFRQQWTPGLLSTEGTRRRSDDVEPICVPESGMCISTIRVEVGIGPIALR